MSYDIEVYGKLRLAPSVVQTGAGPVTASEIPGDGLVQVCTHDSGEYCFIVDGPHDVGGEDMDSVPTGLPDNVRFRYAVVVEGSAQPHIGHALRFADDLAGVVGGVVHDPQVAVEETSDPRYVSRRTGPSREKFLHVEWFRRFDEESPSFAQMYLESAKEHLPAALPTVFGFSEPLRGKLAEEGAEGVDRIYREDGDRSRLVLGGESRSSRDLSVGGPISPSLNSSASGSSSTRRRSPSLGSSAPSRASSSISHSVRAASSHSPRSRSPASPRRWRCRNGVSGQACRRALRG